MQQTGCIYNSSDTMKLLISILLFAWAGSLNAQTFWSSREYRIPGLGARSAEMGARFSSYENWYGEDVNTTLLSAGFGGELSKNIEGSVTGALGWTEIPGVDNYFNLELGGNLTPKYEIVLESGAKVVPYARGGITCNLFSNYRETTVAETFFHRYYYASGDSYFDFYGNYTVGLSYIGVENKWAVSSEIGQYRSLGFNDLIIDYKETIWTSQIYFKVGPTSGIKLMYSVEADSEMKTIGVFWSRVW